MSPQLQVRPSSVEDESRAEPRRLIVVGIRDVDRDQANLAWTLAEARRPDSVHVVHTFHPLVINGCTWDPVQRVRDGRRAAARMVVSKTLQRLRSVHPDLELDGSAVAGRPVEVLLEFSQVVDLLVVGDHDPRGFNEGYTARELARRCDCLLAVIPSDYQENVPDPDHRAITVLADDRGLTPVAVAVGVAEARRQGTSLRIAQLWTDLRIGAEMSPEVIADQQLQLDLALTDVREANPDVGIFTELLRQDAPTALAGLRTGSRAVIVTSRSRHLTPLLVRGNPGCGPTLVVPEPHRRPGTQLPTPPREALA